MDTTIDGMSVIEPHADSTSPVDTSEGTAATGSTPHVSNLTARSPPEPQSSSPVSVTHDPEQPEANQVERCVSDPDPSDVEYPKGDSPQLPELHASPAVRQSSKLSASKSIVLG